MFLNSTLYCATIPVDDSGGDVTRVKETAFLLRTKDRCQQM